MMKTSWFGLGCLIFLVAAPCFGADIGMITLVDGKPKVLRGTAWFNLSEGVRVRDGDTLDVPDKGQLQLELTDGGAVSVVGPGALYAASLTPRDAKQASLAELFLTRGWLKLDTKPPGARVRIRTPLGTVMASDATAVMHLTGDAIEMFVETGSVKMTEATKPDAAGSETKAGGYAARAAGKPVESAARAPSVFVATMPRDFMDEVRFRPGGSGSGPRRDVSRGATVVDRSVPCGFHEALRAEACGPCVPHRGGGQQQGSTGMECRGCQAESRAGSSFSSAAAERDGKGKGKTKSARKNMALAVGNPAQIAKPP
ncbi:MAG: FecR domain-containing protein [Betaproteobacteria bacterium]|nr:MAG: FecR domain-containing protein [Betaproteobacteria bacterium]